MSEVQSPTTPQARSATQYDIFMVVRHLCMDILSPFTLAKGQAMFLLVRVDYLTKWIEAEPLASIFTKCVGSECLTP